jgi:hypothetical protein
MTKKLNLILAYLHRYAYPVIAISLKVYDTPLMRGRKVLSYIFDIFELSKNMSGLMEILVLCQIIPSQNYLYRTWNSKETPLSLGRRLTLPALITLNTRVFFSDVRIRIYI